MYLRIITVCVFVLFVITASASAQIDTLTERSRADRRRPPEQDPGWKLGHTRAIGDLDFSPDGKLIVTCAEDHTVRLWRAQTGKLVRTIAPGYGELGIARFTPDGHAILVTFRNSTLGLWTVSSGRRIAVVRNPEIGPYRVLWTPDGSKFVTAGAKNHLIVWGSDLHVLRILHTQLEVMDICGFTQRGRAVICIWQSSQATVIPFAVDLQTGRKVPGWFDSRKIEALHFSPDQRFAVSQEIGDRQIIRNAATGAILAKGIIGRQGQIVFARSSTRALLIGFVEQHSSNTGRLLSTSNWRPLGPQFNADYAPLSALSPDGSVVAFVDGQQENRFRLFSATSGSILWSSADPFLILGSKPGLTLLKRLSEDYVRYGLALPPASARLAYVEPLGPPRTRQKEPTDRILALVVPAGKGGQKARWYAGFSPETVDNEEIVVTVAPGRATLLRTRTGYAGPRFIGDSDVSMAVFCYRRGGTALGLEFLKRKLEDYRGDVREEFARSAWDYWENTLVGPDRDRKPASKYLHLLYDESQPLRTDHNRSLLADLDITINSAATHHIGIEGEIDELADTVPKANAVQASYGWNTGSIHDFDEISPVLQSLWLRGFDAVPILLQHVDDRRLAYGEMTGMNMYPTHVMRVGEIVSKLLFGLAGAQKIKKDWKPSGWLEMANRKSAEQWWEHAKAIGEEQYLVENVLPLKDSQYDSPNAHNAAILAHKYPEKLPDVYEELLNRYPQAQKWEIAELLAGSKAPQEEKERLLVRTATTGGSDQHIGGFWALVKMKSPQTLDLLIARLDSLPSKPEGADWLREAGALGLMVQELDSPRGWDALERLARRSVVGQRLEILGDLNNLSVTGLRQRHRIEFLAKFVDDHTLCGFSQDAKGFDGPHPAFDLKKITVRDEVLQSISYQVGVRRYPRDDWKLEDWDAWRPEVEAALHRYLNTAPSGK
jgi:hypothetical protein